MTTPATPEIKITAERAPAIVTSRAGVVSCREVFLSARRTDLPPLGQPGGIIVTVGTAQPLAHAVLRVAEGESKRGRVSWSPGVGFLIMTDIAPGDVPSF